MLEFFAEKMWVAFAVQKLLTFFQQKISEYCILNLLKQLTKGPLTSSLSWRPFEQLGRDVCQEKIIPCGLLTRVALGGNYKICSSTNTTKIIFWIGYSLRVWSKLQVTKYRIYPKYSDTSTPYHICSKIWTSTIHYPMLCLKIAGWVANSVDPDETLRSVASHLGLYCLLRPVCPNTYGKYGTYFSYVTMKSMLWELGRITSVQNVLWKQKYHFF